jgi:hypothetical protein
LTKLHKLTISHQLLQKRSENKEQILRTFEDVPIALSRASEALAIHPNDGVLRSYVQDLAKILVDRIPKLVEILLRKHKGSRKYRDKGQNHSREQT